MYAHDNLILSKMSDVNMMVFPTPTELYEHGSGNSGNKVFSAVFTLPSCLCLWFCFSHVHFNLFSLILLCLLVFLPHVQICAKG